MSELKGVIWNRTQTYTIVPPYTPIRAHTPAIRSANVILDMIGDCPMLRRLAQLQIAAENDHFDFHVFVLEERVAGDAV